MKKPGKGADFAKHSTATSRPSLHMTDGATTVLDNSFPAILSQDNLCLGALSSAQRKQLAFQFRKVQICELITAAHSKAQLLTFLHHVGAERSYCVDHMKSG